MKKIISLIFTLLILFFLGKSYLIKNIGIVKVTDEFGTNYGFFFKKEGCDKIFYKDHGGGRDFSEIPNDQFIDILELCTAMDDKSKSDFLVCTEHLLNREIKRRHMENQAEQMIKSVITDYKK
ncbi:hypothetical protein SAMN05660772_02855 [Pasteurella testudinis DSM 23072]|uniref:Uncharacterized protein n=1 Tax=Pasteurella testudinis DSM 23072 TaxID=1122938 RepID=A0A1W1V5R9_9PAST|nr:hypothetical protein [Pasteurella testudinis]SMB88698.1 hypothetical protein SAMN05660772_02855 [Pasteurella testudinis DSM 23072]SUB52164.1 Uncharacterised protein [Pasteurella testudinis]